MAPKSRILPLLLLLSLSALLLYSYFDSSLHLFSQNPNPSPNFFTHLNPQKSDNLDILPLQFGSSNFTFTIKVLAYDRIDSLSRCLRSLANADYGRDRVNINIFIDHFKEFDPKNGSEILNGKIEQSHRILEFVDRFVWRFGEKLVHYRTVNVGLQAQWLEAWWPSSDDEFVFVVEDDLEVSPLYYRFLMGLISKYYYEPENFSPSIYGASLQRPRFVAGKHGNKLHVDSGTRLFLYQMVGTWGQLLFPKPWKEFRLWYDIHKAKGIKPILQGMVTTGWYKKMGERIWTPWFIKFIQSRGYYNIYTNFFPDRALSVSHRDAGVNYGKTAGPDSQLIDKRSLDFNLWEMQPLRNLKWYDFCFKEVIPNRVVGSFDELGSVLNAVHELKIVLLVSLYRTPESITRNLLCHFERLDIRNYILIGGDSELLLDLVRRGHPVIDPLQLIKDVRTPKLREFQGSNKEFIMEILVKAYVIKKCVEFGFHTWSINANVVPISKSFSQVPNVPYDFSTGKNLELLFVKSSQATAKIWVEEFIYKMASYANSLMDKTSLSKDQTNFGYIAAKYLEEKGQGINTVDEMSLGVKIDSINIDNQILLEGAKKMIFWSSVMSLDSIQNRLEDVGMWAIDEGFSCTAVVCHQS